MLHTSRKGMGERENQISSERDGEISPCPDHPGPHGTLSGRGGVRLSATPGCWPIPCCTWRCRRQAEAGHVLSRAGPSGDVRPPAVRLGRAVWADHGDGGLARGGPAIFLARDRYLWSDPALQEAAGLRSDDLTYNTYHTIKAVKDALDRRAFSSEQAAAIKGAVFYRNAASLFD